MEEKVSLITTKEVGEFAELARLHRGMLEAIEAIKEAREKAKYLLARALWMLKNPKATAEKVVQEIEANIIKANIDILVPDLIKVYEKKGEVIILLVGIGGNGEEDLADIFVVATKSGDVFAAPYIVPFGEIKEIEKTTIIVPEGGDGMDLKTTGGVMIKLKKI